MLVKVRSLCRRCFNCEQRARGRKVSGKRKGTREEDGTRRVGTRLGKRYTRMAGECLTIANTRMRGGEDNVDLHPELDAGRCGVGERIQYCMAQKPKHEVDTGAVYNNGYEHCKCPCDVSGGKAAKMGEPT